MVDYPGLSKRSSNLYQESQGCAPWEPLEKQAAQYMWGGNMVGPYFFKGEAARTIGTHYLVPREPIMPAKDDQSDICSGPRCTHCAVYRFVSVLRLENTQVK